MIGDHGVHLALAYGGSALLLAIEMLMLWRRARRDTRVSLDATPTAPDPLRATPARMPDGRPEAPGTGAPR